MDKQTPLISVITPSYNAERFIRETIQSVQQQTYTNWEMVIVDDCSQDNTVEIVTEISKTDDRIKLFVLEENSGSAIARNTAMDLAKGKYIAFLDSDDLWMPEKLEHQVAFMQEKDIAFSFTKYVWMREDGTLTNATSKAPEKVNYNQLMKHCVMGCLTVMLDKEKIGDLKMYNIRTRQDYVYWLHIVKRGHLAYGMPEVFAKYRLVENSISSNKIKAAKRNWHVYRHIEAQPLWKAIWYFVNYAINSVRQIIYRKRMG
ncbi:glycosyltransferase family 2 protein [Oceanobacillus kapialis]|uniref:Glycosyltransferase family 2 protein n=1 Tax=Oceanobacillus kapialis TaxID=481353 RepID=A0ABW5PZY5_9BACI